MHVFDGKNWISIFCIPYFPLLLKIRTLPWPKVKEASLMEFRELHPSQPEKRDGTLFLCQKKTIWTKVGCVHLSSDSSSKFWKWEFPLHSVYIKDRWKNTCEWNFTFGNMRINWKMHVRSTAILAGNNPHVNWQSQISLGCLCCTNFYGLSGTRSLLGLWRTKSYILSLSIQNTAKWSPRMCQIWTWAGNKNCDFRQADV